MKTNEITCWYSPKYNSVSFDGSGEGADYLCATLIVSGLPLEKVEITECQLEEAIEDFLNSCADNFGIAREKQLKVLKKALGFRTQGE